MKYIYDKHTCTHGALQHIHDQWKTQAMYKLAVNYDPKALKLVPDQYQTQKKCEKELLIMIQIY